MGYWEIVVPEATTNLIENPSLETDTTGWTWGANAQGVGWGRSSDASRYGAYSGEAVCSGAGNRYVASGTFTRGANDDVTISVWVRADASNSPSQLVLRLWEAAGGGADHSDTATTTVTTTWQRLTLSVADATMDAWNAGGVSLQIWIINDADNGSNKTWYFDGAQAEALDHVTTYCDGTQKGCEWHGTAHASTSTRSALSRAGGRVYDLDDDYGFEVTAYIDSGVAPLTQHLDEYAIIPGGEVSSYKVHPRVLTLAGHMHSRVGFSTLHDQIQDLIDILKPDAVPGNQPVLLRYNAATVEKEIAVRYEAGLEGNWQGRWCAQQNFAIRFLAADPFWYEIGESGAALDTADTITARYIIGRLRATGQWDDLGLTNNPTAGGEIDAILVGSDGLIYVGGNFTGMNNVANRDYVAYYNPQTDTWSTWGPGATFNGRVYCLAEGPDGTIYAGGAFTDAVGNEDYIRAWDGTNWNAVGAPVGGASAITAVYDMAFDHNGVLYIVGQFTDWASGAPSALDYIVQWNGTSYSAVGTPVGAASAITAVYSVAIDSQNYVYIGGNFTDWASAVASSLDRVCYWDGSAWNAMGSGLSATVQSLEWSPEDNRLYIGGSFANAGGDANADFICFWNGTTFVSLDGATSAALPLRSIAVGPDQTVWTSAYYLPIIAWPSRWNGSAWAHAGPDFTTVGGLTEIHVAVGRSDPVIEENYDVFLGLDATGSINIPGLATVTNSGTVEVRPLITITRSGGTTATIRQIRNETMGKEIMLNYVLLDGESLTIDTQAGTAVSSFFGERRDAVIIGSDLGDFVLYGGANDISAFVSVTGAPTIAAYMTWRNRYWSMD